MIVTIIGSKICYGHSRIELFDYIRRVGNEKFVRFNGCMPNDIHFVMMSNEQFVRFKNAGRRRSGGMDEDGHAKFAGFSDRDRDDRSNDMDLDKWDVASYGHLSGRAGPWGNGALTNRDHMTADSSNQIRFGQGTWPGMAGNRAGVKSEALAITVSGAHHRDASWTYGGRTKKTDTPTGETRSGFGASNPTASFAIETEAMLKWKSNHISKTTGQLKNTLRVETVGAYAYMYIQAVKQGFIQATQQQDLLLINYLLVACQNDDGKARS